MAGEIGCLGDIPFKVDGKTIQTFQNMQMTVSAKVTEHNRIGAVPLVEKTGMGADKRSFTMTLSSDLGVNVDELIGKLHAHAHNGTALPLVIGRRTYGRYRWLIDGLDVKYQNYDAEGNTSLATVSVKLTEYPKD